MAQTAPENARRLALVLEDRDFVLRSFPRGTRGLGDPCRLSVVVNEVEVFQADEDAGDLAPRELIIDIRTQSDTAPMLTHVMQTRLWHSPDSPVIMCALEDAAAEAPGICYVIRTQEITDIVDAIRDGLDIRPQGRPAAAQVRLDAASGGG